LTREQATHPLFAELLGLSRWAENMVAMGHDMHENTRTWAKFEGFLLDHILLNTKHLTDLAGHGAGKKGN
jgi:hypothetical protein